MGFCFWHKLGADNRQLFPDGIVIRLEKPVAVEGITVAHCIPVWHRSCPSVTVVQSVKHGIRTFYRSQTINPCCSRAPPLSSASARRQPGEGGRSHSAMPCYTQSPEPTGLCQRCIPPPLMIRATVVAGKSIRTVLRTCPTTTGLSQNLLDVNRSNRTILTHQKHFQLVPALSASCIQD